MLAILYGEGVGHLALGDRIFDFVYLDLTEAFDLEQVATSGRVHRGNRIVAVGFELCNVNSTDAMCLDRIDVDNEAVLLRSVNANSVTEYEVAALTSPESSLATEEGAMIEDWGERAVVERCTDNTIGPREEGRSKSAE